ncbi:MAG: hypothetical protein ABGY29_03575 [bacterium]
MESNSTSALPAQRTVVAGLFALFVLSLGLRWAGIGHLLPHKNEPDGQIVHLSQDHPDGPFRGKYPFLPIVLNHAVAGGPVDDVPPEAKLSAHLDNAALPFLRARKFLTLLAWLLIPGTFLLARRFFTPGWSLFAAATMGVCPLLLCYSVQARPHALVAMAGVGAMLAALRLTRHPGWGAQLLAGLATGASLSCMHTGLAALVPYGVAALIAGRKFGRVSWLRSLVVLVLIGAMTVWAYWPAEADPLRAGGRGADVMNELGLGEDWRGAGVRGGLRLRDPRTRLEGHVEGVAKTSPSIQIGSHRIYLNYFQGGGFANLFGSMRSYDPALFVLALVGGVLLIMRLPSLKRGRATLSKELRDDVLVVASHGLPILLVLGMYVGSKERFFLPLLPHLALLATAGATLIAGLLKRPLGSHMAAGSVVVLSLALPLLTSVRIATLRTRPDTYSQAAAWLTTTIPKGGGTVVLANMTDIPVRQENLYGVWARRAAVSWRNYQRKVWPPSPLRPYFPSYTLHYPNKKSLYAILRAGDSSEEYSKLLSQWDPDYVFIAPIGVSVQGYVDALLPQIAREVTLGNGGKLVASFSPFGDPDLKKLGLEHYFGKDAKRRLWELEALGPLIDVYSMH